jgi:hypothetical protein
MRWSRWSLHETAPIVGAAHGEDHSAVVTAEDHSAVVTALG